ncbi:hypothetical protein GQ53DRAFT_752260 [Thozetella sp. PMI_491]|nr:hypothetical protein GQ53DRAFT_752260 [Thozetella sp. PMI_491]
MALLLATAFAGLAAALPTELNSTLVTRTDAPFGIKKGLAYNNGAITDILSRPNSATWSYNWGTALNAPKFQQIPMFFSPSTGDTNGVIAKIKAGDTPYVLGYNEPDEIWGNGGCQATPEQAYDAWGNDMFKFQEMGAKLVCPAITSWDTTVGHTGGPAGLTWLRQFARNFNKNPSASGPGQFRCSAQALHWYGPVTTPTTPAATQAQLFIDYIAYAHTQVDDIFQTTNMDIWITEFSPWPVHDAQLMSDFLKIVIPWMDAQSWIARYSPFMAEDLVSGSSLNVAGNTFVNTM